jgi:GMP synthase-like glutamine amidotransferase
MAILVFEHSDSTGTERLGETLRDIGHRLNVLRLHAGDVVPLDLDDVDGIISCGGPPSAYDDSIEWLEPQMSLMRQAHELQMPIVGLCLGSQILARALGGTVERMSGGIEFGWHEVKLSPVGREDPLHAGLAWNGMMFHHHRDHVSQLPAGAKLLAGSAACKVQAWTIGLRSYGFQHHPELTVETIERWMREEPDSLTEANVSAEHIRRETQKHYAAFERLTQRLFENIALLLMPVDRRYAGLVKDLHY